jgi:segregation and condensation protein A
MYTIKTEKFEGPLDLLLNLIEEKKLDISEISLAQVTEQYMAYLEQINDPAPLADFLVVAAKLLWIKSKLLLPSFELEEEGQSLEQQLRIYKEYFDASKKINQLILQKNFTFTRDKLIILDEEKIFNPPKWLNASRLAKVFKEVLAALEPQINLPKAVLEKTVSIQEKIKEIADLLQEKIKINFKSIVKSAKSRLDIIVTFLALLELIRQKMVTVEQSKTFAEINILNKRDDHDNFKVK